MSLISLLDADLAVADPPLIPVRLVELLRRWGIELVEAPDAQFEAMGPMFSPSAARRARARGQRDTRRRMEAAGVEVWVYQGDALSRLATAGPPA